MPWKYEPTLKDIVWEEPFDENEDDQYGLLGELALVELWKDKYKCDAHHVKMTDVDEIKRRYFKLEHERAFQFNSDRLYEIDMMLDFDGEAYAFGETEIRVSWKNPCKLPFMDLFYILGRKGKYINRYRPYPTFYFVFNHPLTMCVMINARDFPIEKTIMTHEKRRGGDKEAGFLINPNCMRILEGNFKPPPEILEKYFGDEGINEPDTEEGGITVALE